MCFVGSHNRFFFFVPCQLAPCESIEIVKLCELCYFFHAEKVGQVDFRQNYPENAFLDNKWVMATWNKFSASGTEVFVSERKLLFYALATPKSCPRSRLFLHFPKQEVITCASFEFALSVWSPPLKCTGATMDCACNVSAMRIVLHSVWPGL